MVNNGRGPTVPLTGGVHGGECEGQTAVSRLARTLGPGRVIMMPANNVPAVPADRPTAAPDVFDWRAIFPPCRRSPAVAAAPTAVPAWRRGASSVDSLLGPQPDGRLVACHRVADETRD